MSSSPILHPEIPYVGAVDGGLVAGKMVKVQGKVPPDAVRFAVNYQLGPSLNPRDDIAIHVSPRFPEGFITRNHIESMRWGMEENDGPMWIQPGQEFEILLLCDHWCYKIAINGRHFAEFAHRLPYPKVTHLVIDGDVEVNSITYEVVPVGPPGPLHSPNATNVPDVPPVNVGPPGPGGLYPTLGPQTPQGYGPPPGGDYGPPPGPGYGPPPPAPYGAPDGYNPPRAYGYQPGHQKAEEEDAFGGCLNKVGLAVGGLAAAGGVAAVMHAINKKKEKEEEHEKTDGSKSQSHSESSGLGNLGALGAALATSLASNALQGNSSQQQGYPQQQSGGGDVLGSILGALGGGGGQQQQPAHPPQQSDALGGAISSILGGFLGGGGGGGHQQPSGGYQPPGGYQPSGGYGGYPAQGYPGGYGGQQQQGSDTTSNFLSGIGSAVGSTLLSNVMDGFSKHGKDKSHGNEGNKNYEAPSNPPQSAPAPTPPSSGGSKMTADEISKGLGLD